MTDRILAPIVRRVVESNEFQVLVDPTTYSPVVRAKWISWAHRGEIERLFNTASPAPIRWEMTSPPPAKPASKAIRRARILAGTI